MLNMRSGCVPEPVTDRNEALYGCGQTVPTSARAGCKERCGSGDPVGFEDNANSARQVSSFIYY